MPLAERGSQTKSILPLDLASVSYCDEASPEPPRPGSTIRASRAPGGGSVTDGESHHGQLSGDGQSVVFSSTSAQHVAGDTNGVLDAFVADQQSGATSRVSVSSSGEQGNAQSLGGSISENGRFVSMYSEASTLLGGDGNAAPVFSLPRRVDLPAGSLSSSTTETVEAWFRSAGSGFGVIVGMQNAAYPSTPTSWTPVLWVGSDGLLRGQFWNGAVNPMTSTTAVNDGKWHHVALRSTGSIQYLHLDGVTIASRSGAVNHAGMTYAQIGLGYGASWPGLGESTPTSYWGFLGKIDEVAFYRSALSGSRISAHKNARFSGYAAAVLSDAPWAYWRLGEATGSTATDASANGRSATYAGGSLPPSGPGLGFPGALAVDDNDRPDVFVRDRDTDGDGIYDEPGAVKTVRVSVNSAGDPPIGGNAGSSALSGNGRFVAFASAATNLVPGDTNNAIDVFLRDRDTDADGVFDEFGAVATSRISVTSSGAQATGNSDTPLHFP